MSIRAVVSERDFGKRYTVQSPARSKMLLKKSRGVQEQLLAAIDSAIAYLAQPLPNLEQARSVLQAARQRPE